jgi:hypothetical protein
MLGELHWGEGKKGQLYEFLKHQKDDDLRFTVFDVFMEGTYTERRQWLLSNLLPTPHVSVIPSVIAENRTEIDLRYGLWLTEGYEGCVVKSHDSGLVMGSCSWVKMKEFQSRSVVIVSIDPSRERVTVKGSGKEFGMKVSTVEKIKLQVGDIIEIEHLGELESGALRNPVYKPKEYPYGKKSESITGA